MQIIRDFQGTNCLTLLLLLAANEKKNKISKNSKFLSVKSIEMDI